MRKIYAQDLSADISLTCFSSNHDTKCASKKALPTDVLVHTSILPVVYTVSYGLVYCSESIWRRVVGLINDIVRRRQIT